MANETLFTDILKKRGRVKESKAIDELREMISEFEAEKKED